MRLGKFFHQELFAWSLTAVWLAFAGAAFWFFGADFDPARRLDVADWAEVATVVSGVFAPIAVLWVVRSFYVQKTELANAVEAANGQAASLSDQNSLMKVQFRPWINFEMEASRNNPVVEDDSVGTIVLHGTIENAGAGAAHRVVFEIIGLGEHDQPLWLFEPKVAYSLERGSSRTFTAPRKLGQEHDNPFGFVCKISCVDVLNEKYEFAFQRDNALMWKSLDESEFDAAKARLASRQEG